MRAMSQTAVVLGASGYAGGEVVRLLAAHPALEVVAASGEASAGQPLDAVEPQLTGSISHRLKSTAAAAEAAADVCFSCLPGGALSTHLEDIAAPVVVDLSGDHRHRPGWAYGLSEHCRAEVAGAAGIANPGCYPTAALLCLVPFAGAGLITGPIVIDALSGLSGAGRKAQEHLSFGTASANATAYGTTEHRHVPEIERGLKLYGGLEAVVSFTPHLAPLARGLLVTARAPLTSELDDAQALDVLRRAYAGEPFVHVLSEWPSTKPLTGSNHAHLSARVDLRAGFIVCSAALDNLGKGAAGQAIQNANLALGLEETLGLESLGVWP
jgi:N-acetyl-gamma-glutamyl-phosphate reductase